ncbi:Cro/C1-type HTH DNA-binding domain-containing protein [Chitinasiproducens palmae]|uniref:Cro/C1-type HTH DNA-binding domain-containing protein n=2 Tax=Chitinasiproducens palmae TaxID=1770053 RepID=A0A1H2PMP1_9BURK|nr:Cro/C1-type HTH DNA-binding domain-containing protein [Chitinasiproducens palmae]
MDRLQQAIATREGELGVRILKKDLARAANVSSSAVTLWYKGSTEQLKAESLFGLARYLRVRPEWLRDNVGPMRDSKSQESVEPAFAALSPAAEAAIAAIRSGDQAGMPAEVFTAIETLLRSVHRRPEGTDDGDLPHLQA